jgi:hypothetical protein
VGASLPVVLALCLTLWHTPFPLTEAVAIFEDVAAREPSRFLVPENSYYRPAFYLTISAIWRGTESLETRLALVRSVHLVAILALVLLFIRHLRPRSMLDAAVAAGAVAVLLGSPGFQDNLELPLSYTIVGMPLALLVFMLFEREARPWHTPAIVLATLVAIGFKEQGLVIVPVVVVAWLTGAPGVRRSAAAAVTGLAGAYVALRLASSGSWPLFEQAIGLGFSQMEPAEAVVRFGAFPYPIYAYNSVATILNVLLSEPTRGTFRIVAAGVERRLDWWPVVQFGSSAALTALIAWWGIGALRGVARQGWSSDARVFVILLVALLACGALSFNYSRDRLGGMAVVFYATAAFHALRAAAERAAAVPRARGIALALMLMVLAAAWHSRTFTTLEYARYTAEVNQRQWLTMLPERREEFADRATYLEILDAMIPQGADAEAVRQTRYPMCVKRVLGLP